MRCFVDVCLFRFFNLISCGRKPRWLHVYLDLFWDSLDDGVEVCTVDRDSRCAPLMKESLHTANRDCFNSSFSFYIFTCIYWWILLHKVASVTLIICVFYVLYYLNYTSMKKGCSSDFHIFLWHKHWLNVCHCFMIFFPTFL